MHLHIPLMNTTIHEYTEYSHTAMETEFKKKKKMDELFGPAQKSNDPKNNVINLCM